MSHFIVSPPKLKGEDGEEVFPLKQYSALKAVGQVDCVRDGCFRDDIVDARREDEA